jgi:hypothetical protein
VGVRILNDKWIEKHKDKKVEVPYNSTKKKSVQIMVKIQAFSHIFS